jgi:DNA-binding MarR family transcriptional regulator
MMPPKTPLSTDIDRTEIESDFGYLVFRAHSVLTHAISQRTLRDLDVTASQGRLLHLVERVGLSHAALIARECDVDPTAVTRLIDRLVRSGLLVRTPNAADRRASRLVLTRQGQIVAGHMPGILTDVYSKVLAGFSVDEVASFKEMLRRILSS